jgi:hypothetical protein
VYEGMCVKCRELLEHGVEDAEELQQKLDNAQQRWNAIQVHKIKTFNFMTVSNALYIRPSDCE